MENIKEYEDAFFNALLQSNKFKCQKVVREFRKTNLSIMILYEEVFKNSLYRIGELWEDNKITVSVEHMATAITEGLMNDLLPDIINLKRKNKRIVISCVENEEHQVGGKMVADVFEKNSWDAYYLGANTPMDSLIEFCDSVKPDLICLSLTIYSNLSVLLEEIKGIRAVTNIPILIGGQALRTIGVQLSRKLKNVFYFSTLETVENFIKECAQYEKGITYKNTDKIIKVSEGLLKEYMDKLKLYYDDKNEIVFEKKESKKNLA